MPMVGIADVRMAMLQHPMTVLMGMPEGAIGGEPLQVLGRVLVLVMGNATAWIVSVAVGMMQSLMAMNVTVLLAQQQHDAGGHQPRSQQQGR